MRELLNFFQGYLGLVIMGASLIGILSGLVGTFAVIRGESLVGDVVSHSALPGIVLAFIFTGIKDDLVLLPGAIISGVIAIGLIILITDNSKIKFDSALALVLSTFFGCGLVLLGKVQQSPDASQSGLESYIFGQAASFLRSDLNILIVALVIAVVTILLFYKELKLFSFNWEYAKSIGFNVKVISAILSTLIVMTVVVGLQTVGVILMSAMIIGPASAARLWSDDLKKILLISSFFGFLSGSLGSFISMKINLPTGPAIVMVLMSIVLISLVFSPEKGLLTRRNKRKRQIKDYYDHSVMKKVFKDREFVSKLELDKESIDILSAMSEKGYTVQSENGFSLLDKGVSYIEGGGIL